MLKKTLFVHYLNVCISVIILSFIVWGFTFWSFASDHLKVEKTKDLKIHIQTIIEYLKIASETAINNNILYFEETFEKEEIRNHIIDWLFVSNKKDMRDSLEKEAKRQDADFFVTDLSSVIKFNSISLNLPDLKEIKINDRIVKDTLTGSFTETGTLNGIYDHACFIIGSPMIIEFKSELLTVGTVFIAIDNKYITDFQGKFLFIFVISTLIAFAVSFLAISMASYNMVQPLKNMANIVRKFGEGNFEERAYVPEIRELAQLATAFNNMAQSLSISEHSRKNFVANISHELRTPMTTISGFIDGLIDGTIPLEKQMSYLSIVSMETKRLARLVSSMLNISKIDSGKLLLNKKTLYVKNILISILVTFDKQIEQKQINISGLDIMQDVLVDGDFDLLHQVFYNLIENAVKFVNQNGKITFTTDTLLYDSALSIKNTGEGIPKSELDFIFDRFYKIDKSRNIEKNGVGLGLYIVKTIIKLHGGDIHVNSKEGEYCEFTICLPTLKHNLNHH